MNHRSPVEWFIENTQNASQTEGPYSAEQIVQWVQSKKIKQTDRVTADWLAGEWITASDLMAGFKAAYGAAAENPNPVAENPVVPDSVPQPASVPTPVDQPLQSTTKSLPTRPDDLTQFRSHEEPSVNSPQSQEDDPAIKLFEIIQALKNKKAHSEKSPPLIQTTEESADASGPSILSVIPKPALRIGLMAGAGILVIVLIVKALSGSSDDAASTKSAAEPKAAALPANPASNMNKKVDVINQPPAGGDRFRRNAAPAAFSEPARPVAPPIEVPRPEIRNEPETSNDRDYRDERDYRPEPQKAAPEIDSDKPPEVINSEPQSTEPAPASMDPNPG